MYLFLPSLKLVQQYHVSLIYIHKTYIKVATHTILYIVYKLYIALFLSLTRSIIYVKINHVNNNRMRALKNSIFTIHSLIIFQEFSLLTP